MQAFHSENPKALTKRSELELFTALRAADVPFEYQYYLPFAGCELDSETKCCYIDFVLHMPWGVVFLENDEHQHDHQSPSCDVRRDFDAVASVALGSTQKVVFLHFNPDTFKVGGTTLCTTRKERYSKLLDTLRAWMVEDPCPGKPFARFFMFYDRDSPDAVLPCVAEAWDPVARLVSKMLG